MANDYYKYKLLFKVILRHDHFSDHVFREFEILPAGPTINDIGNFGLTNRTPPDWNCFELWYDGIKYPFDGDKILDGFNESLHFYFLFGLTDPQFYDYTNLQKLPATMGSKKPSNTKPLQLNYYFFANHDESSKIKANKLLTKNNQVSKNDSLLGFQYYTDNNIASLIDNTNVPFGLISILWNGKQWAANLIDDPADNTKKQYKPPEYQIYFPNK